MYKHTTLLLTSIAGREVLVAATALMLLNVMVSQIVGDVGYATRIVHTDDAVRVHWLLAVCKIGKDILDIEYYVIQIGLCYAKSNKSTQCATINPERRGNIISE